MEDAPEEKKVTRPPGHLTVGGKNQSGQKGHVPMGNPSLGKKKGKRPMGAFSKEKKRQGRGQRPGRKRTRSKKRKGGARSWWGEGGAKLEKGYPSGCIPDSRTNLLGRAEKKKGRKRGGRGGATVSRSLRPAFTRGGGKRGLHLGNRSFRKGKPGRRANNGAGKSVEGKNEGTRTSQKKPRGG